MSGIWGWLGDSFPHVAGVCIHAQRGSNSTNQLLIQISFAAFQHPNHTFSHSDPLQAVRADDQSSGPLRLWLTTKINQKTTGRHESEGPHRDQSKHFG
ncbi:hypothetical protein [Stenotrophomonas maltophilia]|uniref:hypothetical protein n=1 Tax=Stenotrophomonas maltophilia TaxID=40324 RepID=UPI0013DAE651|nr:hypothetical protein [Stenotrophomonas maltophilia]